jgi:hypothetical protein
MATWRPSSSQPIGSKESLGRRLFDEPLLAGQEQVKKYEGLELRHFEEKRSNEFSLDRLGRTNVERAVVNYLLPRANQQGQTFTPERTFHGWAVVRAERLTKPAAGPSMQVVPSPIKGSGLAENTYHAHAVLPARPDPESHYSIALHLRHTFTKHGAVEPAASQNPTSNASPSETSQSWIHHFLHALATLRDLLFGK